MLRGKPFPRSEANERNGTWDSVAEVHIVSEHRGGGRFGTVRNSWPFVTLEIRVDSISMRTIFQEVRMKREAIQTIILQRYFLNHRCIFKHNDPTIEKDIEFWTFSPKSVAQSLRSHGYPVEGAG